MSDASQLGRNDRRLRKLGKGCGIEAATVRGGKFEFSSNQGAASDFFGIFKKEPRGGDRYSVLLLVASGACT